MILKPVSAVLNGVLEKTDTYLPLSQADTNRLLALIPDADEMILTLQDNMYTEYVSVSNQCGTLLVTRGVDSEPRKFPKGTCLFFETSLPVVKWLICNYNCCEDGDCDCVAAAVERSSFPTAVVGEPWEGRVLYEGSTPIKFQALAPDWVETTVYERLVVFTGTPTARGTHSITVSATNCAGETSVLNEFQVNIVEPDTSE